MLQLAILACLVTAPDDCKVAYLTAPHQMSAQQCIRQSVPQVALWGVRHPDYRVMKFRCVTAGHVAFPELGQLI